MTNHLTLFIYFIYNLWKKKLKCISIFLTYIFKRPDLNLKTSLCTCIFSASKIPIFWAICIFILDICSTYFHTSRNSKSSLYKKKLYSVQIESLYFVPYGLLNCCSILLYRVSVHHVFQKKNTEPKITISIWYRKCFYCLIKKRFSFQTRISLLFYYIYF